MADLFARVRALDAEIWRGLDAELDDPDAAFDQDPLQDERAAVVARIVAARARGVRDCRRKLELLAEILAGACADPVAAALLDSLDADLGALDRAGG